MNRRLLCLLIVLISISDTSAQSVTELTPENSFTEDVEGPQIDRKGNLYVVNLGKNGTIGQVFMDGRTKLFVALPEGSTANAIQFDSKGDMLLADWTAHQILKVNMRSKRISVFSKAPFNQPNDITINKKGQLFASDPNWPKGTGKLWRIETNGQAVLLKDDMGTTNGITLSPDEKTLYLNESVQRRIWAFELDDQGSISSQRIFFQFSDFGLDGMKCDRKGNLWVTRHGKGTVVVISPDGKLIQEINLKGTKPSNLVFSKDGKNCFVTMQDKGNLNVIAAENH